MSAITFVVIQPTLLSLRFTGSRYNFQMMLQKMFFSIYSDHYPLGIWRHRDRLESLELYQLSKSDKYKVFKDIIDFFDEYPRNQDTCIFVHIGLLVRDFG